MNNKVYDVNITNGKLTVKPVKLDNEKMSGMYESGWDMLTAFDCDESQWLLVFNLFGPALSQVILNTQPKLASRLVDEYFKIIQDEEGEREYVIRLGDDVSRLTYVLRERISVVLRMAAKAIGNEEAVIEQHLGELRPYFTKIPKYCLTAAHETLKIYIHSR